MQALQGVSPSRVRATHLRIRPAQKAGVKPDGADGARRAARRRLEEDTFAFEHVPNDGKARHTDEGVGSSTGKRCERHAHHARSRRRRRDGRKGRKSSGGGAARGGEHRRGAIPARLAEAVVLTRAWIPYARQLTELTRAVTRDIWRRVHHAEPKEALLSPRPARLIDSLLALRLLHAPSEAPRHVLVLSLVMRQSLGTPWGIAPTGAVNLARGAVERVPAPSRGDVHAVARRHHCQGDEARELHGALRQGGGSIADGRRRVVVAGGARDARVGVATSTGSGVPARPSRTSCATGCAAAREATPGISFLNEGKVHGIDWCMELQLS